ncbi:unnamed protein product [Rotaria sordida]|nr:unnamed protein product [Rotaria sordida]
MSKQSVVSAVWIPIVPQQHDSSSGYDRLHPTTPQLYNVTSKHTPLDNTYSKKLINDKVQVETNANRFNSICHKCKSHIDGSHRSQITFNNRIYHLNCFKCAICHKNLSDSPRNQFPIYDDGEPLCSRCELTTAKTCTVCGTRIVSGGLINFNGMSYHAGCFRCGQCHQPLAHEKNSYTQNMKPCCIQCYKNHFASRCAKCSHPIFVGGSINYNGKKYHQDCFHCGQCHQVVTDSEYYTHLGEPCCIKCFNERIASRCSQCFKIISSGKSITCDGKHYHPDCFCCGQCHKMLINEKDLFKHNEKPCCIKCHEEVFAPRCSKCSRPITDTKESKVT